MSQCECITKKGIRCSRISEKGSKYCWQHTKSGSCISLKVKKVSTNKPTMATQKNNKIPIKKDGDCISRSLLSLQPHQKTIVEYLTKNRGIIASFATGTGKTLTAVTASQCYLQANPTNKVIVVTPKSLVDNFKKEIRNYGADPDDERYEFLTIRRFATKYKNGCANNIFLIIDEAHNLRTAYNTTEKKKNKKDAVCNAKSAVICAKSADKVLLLTATPLYNDPYDLVNLIAMVDGTDPITKAKFVNMKPKELCHYFKNKIMFFQNPKTEDFPTRYEHTKRIKMNADYYKKYRAIELREDHLFTTSNPFIFLTGVRQATNGLNPCQKCSFAIEKIKEGQKTVVYSAFKTYGVKKLQNMLKEEPKPIKYVEITGEMSLKDRAKAVKKYNSGKVKVFFITKAGGEGLDLKGTRNVILLEKSWNRPNEEQIIGRADRYKSHSHLPEKERRVDVYHLIISKPSLKKRDKGDTFKESADDMLDDITNEKTRKTAMFLKLLHSVSLGPIAKCPPSSFDETILAKKKVPRPKQDKKKKKKSLKFRKTPKKKTGPKNKGKA